MGLGLGLVNTSCSGPFRGGTNDAAALLDIGFIGLLRNNLSFGGVNFSLLGDKIFGSTDQVSNAYIYVCMGKFCSSQVIVPYGGRNLTLQQRNYNRVHSKLRIMVEWGINLIMV